MIPIYSKQQLVANQMDGDYESSDFANFLSQLCENDIISHPTASGIAMLANEKGTEILSEKQLAILEKVVAPYNNKTCLVCSEKIPLSEVLEENDGLCSYHKHQADKED
jgi:hypothetical protein